MLYPNFTAVVYRCREKPYKGESYLSFIIFSFERILALDAYFLAKTIITSDLNHSGGCPVMSTKKALIILFSMLPAPDRKQAYRASHDSLLL